MWHLSWRGLAALIICTTVVASSLTFIFDSNGDETSKTKPASLYPGISQFSGSPISLQESNLGLVNIALSSGVPAKYIYLPNIYAQNLDQQEVSPLYARSPAPMGLTDYGFMEPSGLKIPYAYETTSFLGTVMFEDLNVQYLMNSNPDTVAVQLSAVLSIPNGNDGGVEFYWVKNVMLYTPVTGEAQFVSNIWDLSTQSLELPTGSILSGNGELIPGVMYYFAGPIIQLDGENTVGLYISSVNTDGHDSVVFQYTSGKGEHGEVPAGTTYDTVVFSSSNSEVTGTPAKFVVDGFSKTPSGFLKDVELAVTGPGMGSTTSIYSANGQLTLKFLGLDGAYTRLPAAYNYGSNTGETVQGLSIWWTSQMKPMGHLTTGPSLPVSLWGSQVSHSGAVNLQGTIDPANAFVFISMGTKFNNDTAAWAPVNPNGSYKYSLPGRISYTIQVVSSNHEPKFTTIAATEESEEEGGGQPHQGGGGSGGGGGQEETLAWTNFTLDFNRSTGVYTPLYAFDNEQLKSLTEGQSLNGSVVGNGTATDPYILENNQYTRISELFTSTNNFLYPQFSGILIENTDASVLVNSPPSFQYKYPTAYYGLLYSMNLPFYNNLNMIFYNTAGVTISDSQSITGWFPDTMFSGTLASVMFIDSTDFLVASNTFSTMGSSLSVYSENAGSGNGTIWDNTFNSDVILGSNYADRMLNGAVPLGISLFSSGNLVYNNYFSMGTEVASPLYDPYTKQTAMYHNSWNLQEKMNLTHINWVNGMGLHGSIVDCGYQGGNYWESRNVDQLPFNAGNRIAYGGDYIPLVPATYKVNFNASGTMPSNGWSIQFDLKEVKHFTGSNGSHALINGTHWFKILTSSSYIATPSSGTIMVNGSDQTVNITFTEVVYPVTFIRSGITNGTNWTLSIGNYLETVDASTFTVYLGNGSYEYSATVNTGNHLAHSYGSVLVMGQAVTQHLAFNNQMHRVNFELNQGAFNGQWTIFVDGVEYSTSSAVIASDLQNGEHEYTVVSPEGYVVSPSSGSFIVLDGDLTIPLSIYVKTYRITFVGEGLISGTHWQVQLGEQIAYSTQSMVTFDVPVGNYSYYIPEVNPYNCNQTDGYVIISNADVTVNVGFVPPSDYSGSILPVLAGVIWFGSAAAIIAYFVKRGK